MYRPVVLLVLLLAAIPLAAATYIIPLDPADNVSWNHFFYQGASNSWDLTPGSGGGASYYYDAPPAFRNHFGSFLGFNLPTLPPGASVVSALLFFYVTDFAAFDGSGNAAQLLSLGNVAPGTFNGWNAGTLLNNIAPTALGWMQFAVTSSIAQAYADNAPFHAFNLNPYGSGVGSSYLSIFPAQPNPPDGLGGPYLRIETSEGPGIPGEEIPEPATAFLFAVGLAALVAVRSRRV
jgi:hypothetical protein